jgi:phosphoglycerol geranylgeranyltransferase
MKDKIFNYLMDVRRKYGAGYLVLIDPDKKSNDSIENLVKSINESGADAILVGGSLMMDGKNNGRVAKIKASSKIPVIFFPGGIAQLNKYYDAMLFMSVISGRNPHYLIGEQVIAAPVIKDLGLETIPTGYLLMDGGANSTVEFMSGTKPIPMNRPDIVVAHALAAQYLGMKLVYLEAGSGAKFAVTPEIIQQVSNQIEIPVIVGGGIRTPNDAASRVKNGASFIVTGTIIEEQGDVKLMKQFANAVHSNN